LLLPGHPAAFYIAGRPIVLPKSSKKEKKSLLPCPAHILTNKVRNPLEASDSSQEHGISASSRILLDLNVMMMIS
jgi:hypothetical protein